MISEEAMNGIAQIAIANIEFDKKFHTRTPLPRLSHPNGDIYVVTGFSNVTMPKVLGGEWLTFIQYERMRDGEEFHRHPADFLKFELIG